VLVLIHFSWWVDYSRGALSLGGICASVYAISGLTSPQVSDKVLRRIDIHFAAGKRFGNHRALGIAQKMPGPFVTGKRQQVGKSWRGKDCRDSGNPDICGGNCHCSGCTLVKQDQLAQMIRRQLRLIACQQ